MELGNSLLAADRRARAKRELFAEYRRSALIMGISVAAALGILLIRSGVDAAPFVIGGYLVWLAVMVAIGLGVFFACSVAWIGFDQPLLVTVLRLAAIYAIADTVALVIPGVPVLSWLVVAGVYVGLLSKWLQLETRDAVVVALLTAFAHRLALIVVLSMFA